MHSISDPMNIKFNLPPAQRYMLFFLVTLLCMLVGSVAVAVIMYGGADSPGRLRCATVIQDVVMFIAPALITALFITRRPADFLMLRRPSAVGTLLAIAALLAAVPALNAIISWNESLTLPAALHDVEQWMRTSESSAAKAVSTLMGGTGAGSLIVLLLIAGVLAGFSEELFFRGTLQRLIITSGVNAHVAIWVTAAIFSAVHMQFFGFVPRMLLGAYFGYLAWWSRSLWLPVAAHIVNNIIAATGLWMTARGGEVPAINSIGSHPSEVVWSIVMFAGIARFTYLRLKKS